MTSAIELIDVDISKMSETDFKVTVMKKIARLEKAINSNIDSLRAERRADWAELKNSINEMQSNLDTLTTRVNETE